MYHVFMEKLNFFGLYLKSDPCQYWSIIRKMCNILWFNMVILAGNIAKILGDGFYFNDPI